MYDDNHVQLDHQNLNVKLAMDISRPRTSVQHLLPLSSGLEVDPAAGIGLECNAADATAAAYQLAVNLSTPQH